MYFLNFITFLVFYLNNFVIISAENDQCSKNGSEKCVKTSQDNKYAKGANSEIYLKYLREIDLAKKEYIPCTNSTCKCFTDTITKDLLPFINGIHREQITLVQNKGTRYQIINHKLYREEKCMFVARCSGIEHFLKELLPKLPDMELIVNTRDWPQISKHFPPFGPVFSFSKTAEYYDIMYPAWAFWEGGPAISLYPRGIGRWDSHRDQIGKFANNTAWEDKLDKVFFRGSRTSNERDALVLLSRRLPELVDAQYTKNQGWKSDADTLHAPPATEVSFTAHCSYKYLFNFRGVAASFRLKHILLCKSVIFHVGEEWQEFFYGALKPWIHYVPVSPAATETQLQTLVEFVRAHDDVAETIANAGFQLIWNKLTLREVRCYWLRLLTQYARLLRYEVVKDEGFIEIQ